MQPNYLTSTYTLIIRHARDLTRLYHDPVSYGAHKTYNRFRFYAWWINAKQDTIKFVTSCASCQQAEKPSSYSVLPRNTSGDPSFQRVAMDLFGNPSSSFRFSKQVYLGHAYQTPSAPPFQLSVKVMFRNASGEETKAGSSQSVLEKQ
jgi:Integrase zinc binding domain